MVFFLILTLVCVRDTHVYECLCTPYMLYMCVFVKWFLVNESLYSEFP